MNKKYLLVNRLAVAIMALIAIWTGGLISEIAASMSTLLWVFMSDAIRVEKKLANKVK